MVWQEDKMADKKLCLPDAAVIQSKIMPLEASLKHAETHNAAQAWDKRAEAMHEPTGRR